MTAALHCLGGPAPDGVVADWQQLQALSEKARANLWNVLGPSLTSTRPSDVESQIEAFCKIYGVPPADLHAALRVCRFLFSQAASVDLTVAQLAEDLAALSGDDGSVAEVLLAGYERAKATMRSDMLRKTMFDHGKVLTGMDWRVDRIAASDRGLNFDLPVAVVTLRYQEAGQEQRVTVHAAPDAVDELRQACERIQSLLEPRSPADPSPADPSPADPSPAAP